MFMTGTPYNTLCCRHEARQKIMKTKNVFEAILAQVFTYVHICTYIHTHVCKSISAVIFIHF